MSDLRYIYDERAISRGQFSVMVHPVYWITICKVSSDSGERYLAFDHPFGEALQAIEIVNRMHESWRPRVFMEDPDHPLVYKIVYDAGSQ